jgi:hypothetical protein
LKSSFLKLSEANEKEGYFDPKDLSIEYLGKSIAHAEKSFDGTTEEF